MPNKFESDVDRFADEAMQKLGLSYFKKQQDPLRRSELKAMHDQYPTRSGNQNTPMSSRHKQFFNAPGSAEKTSYGEVEISNSRHATKNVEDDYPKDKTASDKEAEKKIRNKYGRIARPGYKNKLYQRS